MTWKNDIPFPAENMSKCRGCGTPIGWVRVYDEEKGDTRAHPVEARGWAGLSCGQHAAGSHKGFTRDGDRAAVSDPGPASLFPVKDLDVVFESHFGHCPMADRFRQAARNKERQQ